MSSAEKRPVAFADKAHEPTDAALSRVLAKAKPHWDTLLARLRASHEGILCEWKFYGANWGWQLKVKDRKRALLYLVPHAGSFLAGMALGPKAVQALATGGLPADLVREVREAKVYPEGRPARVEVRSRKQLQLVERLVALKRSAG